ncbi:PREDICTED: olfactory receptor 12D3, partial [Galeopterus variegatus]|uniref:Olfactory receptor n=1 Tax=Galeopterus variegatus TaxID=482537 RepID=A0ABM0SDF8_GALVR
NEFLLLSLTSVQELQPFFFFIFLIIYLINLVGNGAILVIVILEPKLHSPMYFFLGNLSCLDMCYSSVTLPKVLKNLISTRRAISFLGCITQVHFFHFLGSTEAILLAIMAFDRFAAICKPLRYTVVMSPQVCILLAAVAWLSSFFYALMHSIMTARLTFCSSQKLNHFFCDVKPLLELACSDTLLNQWLLSIVTHFVVVCLFYGPVGFTYIRPASATSVVQDQTVAIIYSAITPVLNPLIYTLRNKEVMLALKKVFGKTLLKDCHQYH